MRILLNDCQLYIYINLLTMLMAVAIITIFIVSLILAVRSVDKEMAAPEEVKNLKINKRKKVKSGVILFLKEKIIHYSSS